MDAPAMLTRKHVPEDAGLRNIAAEEGGQQQLHRDEKQHKPVLKKVKDKVKKIKNTIAGNGHGDGNGNGNGHGDEHERNSGGSNSSDEDEEDAALREAEVEKGGYHEDVEDKPVVTEESGGPELHGAPMYDSERIPAAMEAMGDGAPGVRLGDLGGPVVEDPAAPRSTTPAPRGGEDIGTTDVVRDFEKMTVSDEPRQVGAGKMDVDEAMAVSDGTGEEWKDAPTDATTDGASGGTYTDSLKNTAAGTTENGKKLSSTVHENVAGVGTTVASKAQQVTPGFGARGNAQDDSTATANPESMTVGEWKRDVDEPREGMPVSYPVTEELKDAPKDATAQGVQQAKPSVGTGGTPVVGARGTAPDDTTGTAIPGAGGPGNGQDKGVTVGEGKRDVDEPRGGMPVSNSGTEELKDAPTDATAEGASGATYTDKIKSVAAGTTEYGKKLASTVYEKIAGVGTTVAGKDQQATPSVGTGGTPGVGARGTAPDDTTRTATPGAGGPGNGQDKGVTGVTGYITEMLRPGEEEGSLSEAITGAVQQRKEGVGSTVAKAREAPAPAMTRAREAVTSLTGGNRVSETVQPTTEGNTKEGVAVEEPELRREETEATKTNTNTNVM